ncbi:MAG: outer membrane beta-barrel protein [Gallionella sp.]|nr:outer membrane beta-barrel protein [Gallionella sp.]
MNKIIVIFVWAVLLFNTANARAGEYINGMFLGGKLGVNASSASGKVSAPGKSSLAYGLQGGYLQGGYIFKSETLVLAVGGYWDANPSDLHSPPKGVRYGSRAFGVDAKVGLPLGIWMPYAKLGFGYSTGTRDLAAVAENSLNAAFGMEYKFATQWSMLGEYKIDGFASKNSGTSIRNATMTFGFNYYFSVPPAVVVAPVVDEIEEVEKPVPVVAPTAVTDAPEI